MRPDLYGYASKLTGKVEYIFVEIGLYFCQISALLLLLKKLDIQAS